MAGSEAQVVVQLDAFQKRKAPALNTHCDLCKKYQKSKEARVWCFECDEFLCSKCLRVHRVQDDFEDHKPIPIDDYLKLDPIFTAIQSRCDQHGMKYNCYCVDHDASICLKCVRIHKSCDIKTLTEKTENVKKSFFFCDLKERASDIQWMVQKINEEMKRSQERVESETNRVIVQAARIGSDEQLDQRIKKIKNKEEKILDKIEKTQKMLHNLDSGAKKILEILSQAEDYASNFHTYCGIKHWNNELQQLEGELMSLQENLKYFKRFDVTFNQKPLDKHRKSEKLVSIKCEYTKAELMALRTERQCQETVMNPVKTKITLSNSHSYCLPAGKKSIEVYGCCIMDSGDMIFTDFNNKRLVHVDKDGGHRRDITLQFTPNDIVDVDEETVAVTSNWNKVLVLVDIGQSGVVRTVYEGEACLGVFYYKKDGKFFVNVPKKVQKISLDGKDVLSIETKSLTSYCCVENDQLYYAGYDTGDIFCCDMLGNVKWKYTCDKTYYPYGITVDIKENVIVSCRDGNKVISVDKTGKESKVLVGTKDGINKPIAITYSKKHAILLVVNKNDGKYFLYDLK